jgi:protein phosphatase 2C family protein 2/3
MLGGGISFHPSTGILSEDGALVISTADDSDEDDTGDEEHDDDADNDNDGEFFSSLRGANEDARDVMKSLKAQLDELAEQDDHGHDHDHDHVLDRDGDSPMGEADDEARQAFGTGARNRYVDALKPNAKSNPAPVSESPAPLSRSGASSGPWRAEPPPPSPPHKLPNGKAVHVEQLKSKPGGDAPEPVVKAEGLMDRSEDPTRVEL